MQSVRKAAATGGVGIHGITASGPTGVDPLFSQGAVVVNQISNVLAAINRVPNGLSIASGGIRSLDLNQTTPANGTLGAIKGTPNSAGYLAVWDIDCDGALSEEFKTIKATEDNTRPFSATLIPGQNAILSADSSLGYQIFDLSSSKAASFNISGQGANCWSSYSPAAGHYYLSDAGMSIVNEISINENLQGTLVQQYQLLANSSTLDNAVASIGDRDFFAGQATTMQRVDISGPGSAAGLDIDPFNLQGMATFIKI
ncbi:hypothetical protein MPER_12889 [Moniliophthora perniciosa FA553]|nr:hypothetical protein MPER_12889 [Moniliophthora perniciosa FA553]